MVLQIINYFIDGFQQCTVTIWGPDAIDRFQGVRQCFPGRWRRVDVQSYQMVTRMVFNPHPDSQIHQNTIFVGSLKKTCHITTLNFPVLLIMETHFGANPEREISPYRGKASFAHRERSVAGRCGINFGDVETINLLLLQWFFIESIGSEIICFIYTKYQIQNNRNTILWSTGEMSFVRVQLRVLYQSNTLTLTMVSVGVPYSRADDTETQLYNIHRNQNSKSIYRSMRMRKARWLRWERDCIEIF